MYGIKKLFKSLVVALVILALPAAPFLDRLSSTTEAAESCCGPVCACCGETGENASENSQSMAPKCSCNMEESEPAEEIPPLTASSLSKNTESSSTLENNSFYAINIDSPKFVLKAEITFDDTGPPLYLVHDAFLI